MKADDRQQGQGLGRGERLELLHPAERGGPDQSVETQAGVGDQPHAVADPEEHRREGGRLAAGGRQLAGHGPDGEEHGGGRHHGQGEVERGAGADSDTRLQPGENRDDRGDPPEGHASRHPDRRSPGPSRPAGWFGQQRRRSQRPLSSSPRSSLVLVSSPHTAPRIISVMEILKTVNPLTVWSCGAGPKRALIALLVP